VVLNGDGQLREFGKIEMALAVVDMAGQPRGGRLDFGVPWVTRLVAVAVVAGRFKQGVNIGWNIVFGRNVVRIVVRQVFFRTVTLEKQKQCGKRKKDPFQHDVLVLCTKVTEWRREMGNSCISSAARNPDLNLFPPTLVMSRGASTLFGPFQTGNEQGADNREAVEYE
jgi:hypothetical protein